MAASNTRMPKMQCPSCGKDAFARTGGKRSMLYREIYYHCFNDTACGHVFVVSMMALRTVRPSMIAQPIERLPLTTWRHAANDRAANDDDGPPDQPRASQMSG